MNAINAYNRLNANVAGLKKASEKLSSGYRINRAGDDAAGLAISEKMRSQIKGLNQATRNAQDGINMIQTFEGAAQETHSILQRMKELATESANGTYDNPTDRAAIELEFSQLNDELNQIADTDFNGTIVLNGGEMADGLRVTPENTSADGIVKNGEFDYRKKAAQIEADKAALTAEKDALDKSAPKDLTTLLGTGKGTVDENGYDLDAAKALWGTGKLELSPEKVKNISVTWEAKTDADGKLTGYDVVDITDQDGNSIMTDDMKTIFAATLVDDGTKAPTAGTADQTGSGGFKLGADTGNVNVILDNSKVGKGDKITLKFDGPGISPKAPANRGMADDSLKTTGTVKLDQVDETQIGIKVEIEDDDMTEDTVNAFNALQGVTVKWTVKADDDQKVDNKGDVALTDGTNTGTSTTNTGKVKLNGVDFFIKEANAGKMDIYMGNDDTGTKLFSMDFSTNNIIDANTSKANDTVEFKLAFQSYQAPEGAGVDVAPIASKGIDRAEVDKKIAEIDEKLAQLNGEGSTKADSFDESLARLTYANNITLQTGARTKDSVNFTFKYNTDGSADMGELKANLNLSSRADGLNTANLTLSNAKDANKAIDQIDKAINKTSMVRATFGSIQNRLEHKITNLTTTSENLTEAESSIRDTDMASEMMNYTKFNILQQAAQSMLAQANQQPQSVLQLLG